MRHHYGYNTTQRPVQTNNKILYDLLHDSKRRHPS
jgi:hypothetical protein